jgi:nucleoid DNA-binding protein
MARTRRKNVLSLALIREKVDEKCTEKKIAVKDDVRNAIIDACFSAIRGSLKSKNRKDGDFIDIPGLVRIYVREDDESVVRIPRTGEYLAKGKSRSLKFKILKPMKDQLEDKFAKKPGQKTKDTAIEKNVERLEGLVKEGKATDEQKATLKALKGGGEKVTEKKAEEKKADKPSGEKKPSGLKPASDKKKTESKKG